MDRCRTPTDVPFSVHGDPDCHVKGGELEDRIDPNPIYETDRRKSTIAEIITLGRADPYRISITWSEETTVSLDASGNVTSASGYPFS